MEDKKTSPKNASKKMTDKRQNNKKNCPTNPKDNEGCSTPPNATVSDAQSPNTRRAAFKDVEKTSYDKSNEGKCSAELSKKCKKELFPDTADQTSDHLNSSVPQIRRSFSPSLLSHYPWIKEQGKQIEEGLSAEAKKQGTSPKALLESQQADYSIEAVNSTAARVITMLAHLLLSVGWITWNNQGITGSDTCFVLEGFYILTCHHVIRMIVGEGVQEKFWARVISNVARVTFTYEGPHPPQDSFYSIEPWLDVADENLDYVLLKLQENHNPIPRGLYSLISKEPLNGLVYIISHPGGHEKTTNECTVIPFINRLHEQQPLYIFSQSSFRDSMSPRVLTYGGTSFFRGFSGSPVFDSSGQLVAMLSAGYAYLEKQQSKCMIEFGWPMSNIWSDIQSKCERINYPLLTDDSNKADICNDVNMESASSQSSQESMEVEYYRPPTRKRKHSIVRE